MIRRVLLFTLCTVCAVLAQCPHGSSSNSCPISQVGDRVDSDQGGETRKLQSTHRVVVMPTPPNFFEIAESVVNYLVVHEAYFAWSKEWFPKPLADAWFEFAGNKMFERFEFYMDELVKHFEEFLQSTINRSFTQKHCRLELSDKRSVVMDHRMGLKGKAEIGDLEGMCDFKYEWFGRSDLQIGRTAFTQFTIDFDTVWNNLVTVFRVPVKFGDAYFRGYPISLHGSVIGNLNMEGAPSGVEVTLNGPKLKPWGPDQASVVNTCVEKARYNHIGFKVDYCYAKVYVETRIGYKFSCPWSGGKCPLDADPTVCEYFCAALNKQLCSMIEDSVNYDTMYISDFLDFSTNSQLPYCESGTKTDSVF